MIVFNNELDFKLTENQEVSDWLTQTIDNEVYKEGEINFIFCDDDYLLKKNVEFLNHDTLTDIISFDYTIGKLISGDIFISIERVMENADDFGFSFIDELHRVMVHGILHFCGYNDKTESEAVLMRSKEDYYLSLRKF